MLYSNCAHMWMGTPYSAVALKSWIHLQLEAFAILCQVLRHLPARSGRTVGIAKWNSSESPPVAICCDQLRDSRWVNKMCLQLSSNLPTLHGSGLQCSVLGGCTSGTSMVYLAKTCDTSLSTGLVRERKGRPLEPGFKERPDWQEAIVT